MNVSNLSRVLLLAVAVVVGAGEAKAGLLLYSQYNFDGNLSDSLGNSGNLTAVGTPTFSSGKLLFGEPDGVSLSSPFFAGDFRVEFDASFNPQGFYSKLLDFQNRGSDNGLYLAGGLLNFYDVYGSGSTTLASNTQYTIGLEKISDKVTVYLNGSPEFSFVSATQATPLNNTLHFFVDDLVFTGEGAVGSVDTIRLYVDASSINAVPEPSSLVLATILGGVAVIGRRLRKR